MDIKLKIKYPRLIGVLLVKSFSTTFVCLLLVEVLMRFIGSNIYSYESQQHLGGMFKGSGEFHYSLLTLYNIYSNNTMVRMLTLGVFFFSINLAVYTIREIVRTLRIIERAIESVNVEEKHTVKLTPEMRHIEECLNELKLELRTAEVKTDEAQRRRSEMVMFLAHDLKTPLTSVIAYVTMLQQQDDLNEEDKNKYIKIVAEKAQRLQQLIEEFFQISKYHMQDIELDTEVFDISLMLEQISYEIGGVLKQKNLTCKLEAQDNLCIQGDTNKLARVFDNILRNAMNYCYENTEIKITVEKINSWVEICISNQGEPIPESKLSTIFEKFYRLDDARSSITGGSGLGLAISREIIDLHKGMIFAQSNPRETTFIIRIPLSHETRLH